MAFGAQGKRAGPLRYLIYLSDLKSAPMAPSARATSGYIDDGFLFIRGRADDVIVLDNGKKVIVRPTEEYLKADPRRAWCCAPLQPSLVAVVSPASDPADAEAIKARVASRESRKRTSGSAGTSRSAAWWPPATGSAWPMAC